MTLSNSRFIFVIGAAVTMWLAPAPADATPVFFNSSPYLSFADSPFSGSAYSMYVETFEYGLLNTPGVSASGGNVINGEYVDSVDAFGPDGHSWYSNFVLDYFTFTFDQCE